VLRSAGDGEVGLLAGGGCARRGKRQRSDVSGQDRGTTSSCHSPVVSKVQPKVLLSRPPADGSVMPTGSDPQSVQSYCLASGARVYNPREQTLTNDHATVFTWWLGGLP